MVMMALQSCSSKDGMTICQIYDYIIQNFSYYRYVLYEQTLPINRLEWAVGNCEAYVHSINGLILRTGLTRRLNKAPSTWRSRVRNVLTVNDCFRRIPDPKGGRKGKWMLTNRGRELAQNAYVDRLSLIIDVYLFVARCGRLKRCLSSIYVLTLRFIGPFIG